MCSQVVTLRTERDLHTRLVLTFSDYLLPHFLQTIAELLQAKAVIELKKDGQLIRVPWIDGSYAQGGSGVVVGIFWDITGYCLAQAGKLSEESKEKIRSLSQGDIPIQKRRGLYNAMGCRFKHPVGLKPGLLQKYLACVSCKKNRFNLLKEFLIH